MHIHNTVVTALLQYNLYTHIYLRICLTDNVTKSHLCKKTWTVFFFLSLHFWLYYFSWVKYGQSFRETTFLPVFFLWTCKNAHTVSSNFVVVRVPTVGQNYTQPTFFSGFLFTKKNFPSYYYLSSCILCKINFLQSCYTYQRMYTYFYIYYTILIKHE